MSIKLNIDSFAQLSTDEYDWEQPCRGTMDISALIFQEAVTCEAIPRQSFIFYICSIISPPTSIYKWDIILSQSQYDAIYQSITNGNATVDVPAYTGCEKAILIPNLENLKRVGQLTKYYKNTYYSSTTSSQNSYGLVIPSESKQVGFMEKIKKLNEQISGVIPNISFKFKETFEDFCRFYISIEENNLEDCLTHIDEIIEPYWHSQKIEEDFRNEHPFVKRIYTYNVIESKYFDSILELQYFDNNLIILRLASKYGDEFSRPIHNAIIKSFYDLIKPHIEGVTFNEGTISLRILISDKAIEQLKQFYNTPRSPLYSPSQEALREWNKFKEIVRLDGDEMNLEHVMELILEQCLDYTGNSAIDFLMQYGFSQG